MAVDSDDIDAMLLLAMMGYRAALNSDDRRESQKVYDYMGAVEQTLMWAQGRAASVLTGATDFSRESVKAEWSTAVAWKDANGYRSQSAAVGATLAWLLSEGSDAPVFAQVKPSVNWAA